MLSTMLQRTTNWTIDSLRLFRAVALAPSSSTTSSSGQFRLTLLQYANEHNNQVAKSMLRVDREIGLVRYYGMTRYLYEKKILPVTPRLPSILANAASSSSPSSPSPPTSTGAVDGAAATPPATTTPTSPTAATGAKIPFMITKSMRADLEELSYALETIKSMTPIQASLVLRHSLPPERYETEIDALMKEEDLARASIVVQMVVQTKDNDSNCDDASSLSEALPDEPRNDKETTTQDDKSSSPVVVGGETTSITTTSTGRLWYEVIEHPENGKKKKDDDPYILGLFLQEHEALACQKVHEELAVKKNSRSTFATRATTKP
jgi:hypothetical protein